MTIRAKLFLSITIVIFLSLVIVIVVLTTTQQISRANETGQQSDKIVREIFQQTFLLNDYLLHHEERSARQWQVKHKAIDDLLASQKYSNPKDQATLNSIIETHANADDDFSQLVMAHRGDHSGELPDRLTSLLLVKSQSMVSKSIVLSEKSYNEQKRIREMAVLVLAFVIGGLMISTTILLFLLHKSIVGPIEKLNKGTKRIAAGNWDYKVELNSTDEVGQLANAFNSMTAKINSYITEQKQLERQKDDFIAAASHELKTPLTIMTIYIRLLNNKFKKEADIHSEDILQKMDRQLRRLLSTINDLLDVQKIAGGKLQYAFEFFDMNELVNEIIQEMQLTTKSHKIVAELAKSRTVYGSRTHIGQVLTNFITNAIKYSPNKDKIIVGTKIHGQDIIVDVRDFGIGIVKKDQEKVFERFYRAGGEIEKTYPGIGLGLYISRQIIMHHGGKIWVESREGKGSLFSFSLPIKETEKHHL